MKSRKLSRKRSRTAIVTAAAASVVAGVALVPNWSAGAAVVDDPTVDAATKATFQKLADAVFTDRTQALSFLETWLPSKPPAMTPRMAPVLAQFDLVTSH